MVKTIIQIPSWECPNLNCPTFLKVGDKYNQDFEPTPELMKLNHGYREPLCPSCKQVELVKTIDRTTIEILGEEEVDLIQIPDKTLPLDDNLEYRKRLLTFQEKTAMRAKINADIAKFRALEE